MPHFILSVTMDPRCHFPSSWKMARGALLTDSVIEKYEREGYYGPDAQRRRLALDNARVVNGVVRLPKPCVECGKDLGHWMTYGYLPKAGHYCNLCRQAFKDKVEHEHKQRAFTRSLRAFE